MKLELILQLMKLELVLQLMMVIELELVMKL